jgi:hypothetical protein
LTPTGLLMEGVYTQNHFCRGSMSAIDSITMSAPTPG